MYILNFVSTIEKMSVNEIRDLTFENYINELDFIRKVVIIE